MKLTFIGADHEVTVEDHGVNHDHDDSVKDLFPVAEQKLG